MPFGLTNAPTLFMTLMDIVLHLYLGKIVLVFLDDILMYSKTHKEHKEHLRLMFELLRQHSLFVKERKCVFFAEKIQYLGHIISTKGMWMDPKKVEAILRWLAPRNLQELQIFLGMSSFYKQYVRDYAKIYAPILINCDQSLRTSIGGRPNRKALKNRRWLLQQHPFLILWIQTNHLC